MLYSTISETIKLHNHRLSGDNISHVTTLNTSGEFKELPDTLVIHFTGGGSLASSVKHMQNKDSKVSAHIVVGQNGDIVQLLPFNAIAWHAGKSSFDGRQQLNNYSIGIELDNAGQLEASGHGEYSSWFGKKYQPGEVFVHTNANSSAPLQTFWHRYNERQLLRTFELCRVLCNHYHIRYVVGHQEIAPRRKVDPGPAFPLNKLRSYLINQAKSAQALDVAIDESETSSKTSVFSHPFNHSSYFFEKPSLPNSTIRNEEELELSGPLIMPLDKAQPTFPYTSAIVNAKRLNVRTGPGTEFETLKGQLKSSNVLRVLETQGNWSRVSFNTQGWVNNAYLTFIKQKE